MTTTKRGLRKGHVINVKIKWAEITKGVVFRATVVHDAPNDVRIEIARESVLDFRGVDVGKILGGMTFTQGQYKVVDL